MIADGLRTGLRPDFGGPEPDDTWKMPAPRCGATRVRSSARSDAGAHLDMMCMAGYSTFVVGDAVRDLGLLSIEEAVRLLTDVPARLYGARRSRPHRGRARTPTSSCSTRRPSVPAGERTLDDLPGGASRIVVESHGVDHVLVAGTEIVADGDVHGRDARHRPAPPALTIVRIGKLPVERRAERALRDLLERSATSSTVGPTFAPIGSSFARSNP